MCARKTVHTIASVQYMHKYDVVQVDSVVVCAVYCHYIPINNLHGPEGHPSNTSSPNRTRLTTGNGLAVHYIR